MGSPASPSGDPSSSASNTPGFLRRLHTPAHAAGIYIHVPYCASRCTYCDFYSVGQGGSLSDSGASQYIEALGSQIKAISHDLPLSAETLYIGGGTPSLLGPRVVELVELVDRSFGLAPNAEVTVEANPDDLTSELLAIWSEAGVNRVSVGVQALDDPILRTFGRRHTAVEALEAIDLLGASTMRWSVDLIAGIPSVDDETWLSWVQTVVERGASHISVYPLTIEEGTVLAARVERGEYSEPNPDSAATQMLLAEQYLAQHGLMRYEIANYARVGEESRHNMSYWTGVPYIGLGPSAASMLPTTDGGRVRFTLHGSVEEMVAEPERASSAWSEPAELEILSASETLREDAMLGLRTARGVDSSLVERAGVREILYVLEVEGLVVRVAGECGGQWVLTEQGWLLGNEVFSRVLFD